MSPSINNSSLARTASQASDAVPTDRRAFVGSMEALSDTPALKFPSSETPDVQMISVQTRLDAVSRELDLDFGLVCRHQFCADRARYTSSGSGEECAIGCSARQFSVKHRCTRLFAKHCFSKHLGASRFWLTAEGKAPKG